MVREALSEALKKVPDIDIIGEAGDAQEALKLAAKLKPDVIVLDIRLPDVNGMEVAARLKDAGITAKIVALSASVFAQVRDDALAAGCDEFLTKPIDETQLFGTLARLLGLSLTGLQDPQSHRPN